MNKKTSLKVLCLGNSQTGKTSFINRLVFNTFNDNVMSTIIGKNTEYKKDNLSLSIWDTPGQERFRSLTTIYMKNCDIIFLFFSITDRNSFEEIRSYYYNKVLDFCKNENPSKYKNNI